jgi:hypothetical protein
VLRLALLAAASTLLATASAVAQQLPPQGQRLWPAQYNPYGFRPLPESNARGVPPNTQAEYPPPGYGSNTTRNPVLPYQGPWGQGMQQYQGTQQTPRAEAPPRLVARLASNSAYVQQTLVLTLEVASDTNLKTLDPRLPKTDALVFRKVGSWEARARTVAGKREIVNRLNYLVTPVRAGSLTLDPFQVTGEAADGHNFTIIAATPFVLEVLPPKAKVVPWLPLASLDVTARLINDDEIEGGGGPVTLIIEQEAVGATGAQLPSLERQLRQGEYRLYLEDSQVDGRVTPEGELVGSRVETFTLVPFKNHELLIPTVRLQWWNTTNNEAETAILPSRLLNAPGGLMNSLSDRLSGGPFVAGSSWVFWLPLTIFAFVTGLYWTWIWAKSRRFGDRLRLTLMQRLNPVHSRLGRVLWRLSPRRHLHLLRRAFANSLPYAYRLWFCVRSADAETDPSDWSQVLRFLVERRLETPAHVPTPQLADIIIRLHPAADPQRVRQLLGELDAAIFGRHPMADFAKWKRNFKAEIRPRLFTWRHRHARASYGALPALNP